MQISENWDKFKLSERSRVKMKINKTSGVTPLKLTVTLLNLTVTANAVKLKLVKLTKNDGGT